MRERLLALASALGPVIVQLGVAARRAGRRLTRWARGD